MLNRELSRRLILILWGVGIAATLIGTGVIVAGSRLPGTLLLGSGLLALGLNILIAGELTTGAELRPYVVRGPVVRGQFEVRMGLSDLSVGLCPNDRIAAVQYGPLGKPEFEVLEGVAHLRLKGPAFPPNIAHWKANLASNVLWDIEAHSWLGYLTMDLSQLRLDRVVADTVLGRLNIVCPARGNVRMQLKARLGEIELRIPPEVGAQVVIKKGELASLTVDNERLLALSRGRYATADFDTASAQVEIHITSPIGDITIT